MGTSTDCSALWLNRVFKLVWLKWGPRVGRLLHALESSRTCCPVIADHRKLRMSTETMYNSMNFNGIHKAKRPRTQKWIYLLELVILMRKPVSKTCQNFCLDLNGVDHMYGEIQYAGRLIVRPWPRATFGRNFQIQVTNLDCFTAVFRAEL